uniref:Putative peritrophin-1 n=1 Tax=Lutzomyia longipalpis TaxID=7200 RepID=A0A1B0CW70_LUTLO
MRWKQSIGEFFLHPKKVNPECKSARIFLDLLVIFWGLLCLLVRDIVSEDWLPPIDFCAYLLPGLHPSPRSCNDFIMCTESGVPMRGTCGDNYHFKAISPGVRVCTYPEESGCDLSGRECKPEDFWEERVPMTCNQYVRCFHGEITIRQCEKTLHWDSVRQQCTFNFLSDCPYIVCSEDAFPGYNEVIPHPTDCSAFFLCDNGKPTLQNCGSGTVFMSK